MLSRLTAMAAIILCSQMMFGSSAVQAQQDICIVDVSRIFESHQGFNAQLEGLKQAAEQYKVRLQDLGQQLRAKSERLQDFSPSSEEYRQLENELASTSANLEVERRAKTREFVQLEARLHFDTYVEISRLIAQLCEQNGFRLAMRFDSTPMTLDDPQSIPQRINGSIVYFQPQKDITDSVIRMVNQAGQAQVGPGTQTR